MSGSVRQQYRKINTHRGVYFVRWQVDAVTRLLIDERLTPFELMSRHVTETHRLIRDLYLLACAGTLGGTENQRPDTALLAQYAHTLRSFLNTQH